MNSYIFIISVLLLLLFLFSMRSISVIYLKNLLFPFLCICFILLLILFSSTAVEAASNGIRLWLYVVFPSLFPFFVASQFLSRTGFVKAAGVLLEPVMRPIFNVPGCGSFAFAMGISSGYPTGAKITADLREEGMITKLEAERLLTFTNNSGPLFIIGAVAVGMFSSRNLGIFLLCCHIAACVTVGFLFRYYGKKRESIVKRKAGSALTRFRNELRQGSVGMDNLGSCFGEAIRDSVSLILNIGGFIIFFSVIIRLLSDTGIISFFSNAVAFLMQPLGVDKNIITACISGIFEITSGASLVSKAVGSTPEQQIIAVSMIIGWAGLSVHSQVISIISKTDISIKPYLLGKCLQGVFAAAYAWIGSKILFSPDTIPTFSQAPVTQAKSWYYYLAVSSRNLLATVVFLAVCVLFIWFFRYLRRLSANHRVT
jgi:sporulation integral membrane protein YlbJ